MAIVLENALLVDLDPVQVEPGSLRIEAGRIVARGPSVPRDVLDEAVDCRGAAVLPGLVNGHTHLYSALATGMPPPPRAPADFQDILKLVWWRLDRALDAESIEMSARIGALDALHCGTTTLIDHHASPDCIPGALDQVEHGLTAVGLRGVLCYETTDRNGARGRQTGLEENRRYLNKCMNTGAHRFAGLVGGHANFTLEEDTLDQLAALAKDFGVGLHIHVAEDLCDEDQCLARHQVTLVDWLAGHGVLRPESVFAHGTHLGGGDIERVGEAGTALAHCPRSNMNNAVGYAPVAAARGPVLLGTDGIGSDMFAEARAAWFIAQHEKAGLAPHDILRMLAASARRASAVLDVPLGRLAVDAAADVVLTDYRPATPVTSENLPGHFLFGLGARHVVSVLVDGRWALRDRAVRACDEPALRRSAAQIAARLWERMAKIS